MIFSFPIRLGFFFSLAGIVIGLAGEDPRPASPDSQSLPVPTLRKKAVKLSSDVMNVEKLGEAAKVCERILERKPDDFETLILFSRLCWSLGNHAPDKGDQKEWFKRGQAFAKQAQELNPEKPDGYYWFGVNYGEWVDRSSIFVKIGAKKIILDHMAKVLALDDTYDSGGAYIVVGRINYIAPGGSYAKAIQYFERAIALGPKRTTAYVYLGELYLHEHLFDKAEKLFTKVISMDYDHRYAIEAVHDIKEAHRLLRKTDKKEDRFPAQDELTGR